MVWFGFVFSDVQYTQPHGAGRKSTQASPETRYSTYVASEEGVLYVLLALLFEIKNARVYRFEFSNALCPRDRIHLSPAALAQVFCVGASFMLSRLSLLLGIHRVDGTPLRLSLWLSCRGPLGRTEMSEKQCHCVSDIRTASTTFRQPRSCSARPSQRHNPSGARPRDGSPIAKQGGNKTSRIKTGARAACGKYAHVLQTCTGRIAHSSTFESPDSEFTTFF